MYLLILFYLTLFCLFVEESSSTELKEVLAVRSNEAIYLDGLIRESPWQCTGYNDFIQREPDEGRPATQITEVRCAYDDEAFYVAARLYDTAPDSIVGRLGRRDNQIDSDWFRVYLDPYHDGQTGFYFGVNPSGSIEDGTIYNDCWFDNTWDGIWESATFTDEQGWTVEMKIPYSQLRFKKMAEHIWGINFSRKIHRRNEYDFFIMVPKKERGFVSRFADLKGIRDIRPTRRVEILPYVVGSLQSRPHEPGDPFHTGKDTYKNMGADIKLGLSSSLTLDAAFNPDFGQVEVDPAVVNLSDFETYYYEKRPFFIEGSNILEFGWGGATSYNSFNFVTPIFFYSRRIGGSPHGGPTHDGFDDTPRQTTILGAGKLTGKIDRSWSLGVLSSVTSREYTVVDSSGIRFKEEVEPLSCYNVIRSRKEFNEGRQALGMIATGVFRDLRNPALIELLNRQACVFGVDGWTFLDKDKTWVITGWTGGTYIKGNKEAILKTQRASAHYFQRPDADHVLLDSTATLLSGWAGRVYLNKEKGNFRMNVALGAISPGFDVNDIGFHWKSDIINSHFGVGYRWYEPGKLFRQSGVSLYTFRSYDFGWNKTGEGYFFFANGQFLNYWGFYFMAAREPSTLSNSCTRGGPLMNNPAEGFFNLQLYTDHRKPLVFNLFIDYFNNTAGTQNWWVSSSIQIKPSSNLNFSLEPRLSKKRNVAQWITAQEDLLATDTYGTRYVFAEMDQTTISMSTRINWAFSPKLSFQLYMQPFMSVGNYREFKELARPKTFHFNKYSKNGSIIRESNEDFTVDPDGQGPAESFPIGNPDFNFKSLRGTALLRWEYRQGSVFYLVWTHDRSDDQDPGDFHFMRDIRNLVTSSSNNIFLIKFTYWWNP